MRWIMCFSFLLFQFYTEAQSIYTVLRSTDETPNKGRFKVIEESKAFYLVSGIKRESRVSKYNENQQLLVEKRYDKQGDLIVELIFGYDRGLKVNRKYSVKIAGDFSTEFNAYIYSEQNHLIGIVYYDSDSVVTRQAALVNNENGHPIQLSQFRGEVLMGIEEARYDYSNNRVFVRVLNKSGDLISEVDYPIDLKVKNPMFTYDEIGNLIASPRNFNKTDEKYYFRKYKYDDNGNWTTMTIYVADKRGDKYVNLAKDRVFKRKITYYE